MKILYPNIKYNIFDSITTEQIQSYYIKNQTYQYFQIMSQRNHWVNIQIKIDLFIALWSISEIPINNRKKFEKIILIQSLV